MGRGRESNNSFELTRHSFWPQSICRLLQQHLIVFPFSQFSFFLRFSNRLQQAQRHGLSFEDTTDLENFTWTWRQSIRKSEPCCFLPRGCLATDMKRLSLKGGSIWRCDLKPSFSLFSVLCLFTVHCRRTCLVFQDYLKSVIEVLEKNTDCILHPSRTKVYSKQTMHQFHVFFKKGLFETSKHGTG